MSFQWENLNQVSKYLIDMDISEMSCDEQAFYRAAISRSYYAAFKTSQEWIESNPHTNFQQPIGIGSHEATITHIGNHFGVQQSKGRKLKLQLTSLKASRVKADYDNDPSSPVTKSQAENILTISGAIINSLKMNPVARR